MLSELGKGINDSFVFKFQMVTLTKHKAKHPKSWADAPAFVPVSAAIIPLRSCIYSFGMRRRIRMMMRWRGRRRKRGRGRRRGRIRNGWACGGEGGEEVGRGREGGGGGGGGLRHVKACFEA